MVFFYFGEGIVGKTGFLGRPTETTDKQSPQSYHYSLKKITDTATKVNTLQKKIFIYAQIGNF
jgi:hypothetical protein